MNTNDTGSTQKVLTAAPVEAAQLEAAFETAYPILHRALTLTLMQRAFKAASQTEVPTDTLSFWHKLLVENAKLPVPGGTASALLKEADLMELIWDVFLMPEEERAKRRAAFASRPNSVGGVPDATAPNVPAIQPNSN